MAIGTTAAIIGSAVIGAGASAIGASNNRRAINSATNAQTQANAQNLQLQRDVFNQQRQDFEPFRDFGVRQINAVSDLTGLNNAGTGITSLGQSGGAVPGGMGGFGGANQFDQYVNANPDLQQEYSRVATGGFGPNLPQSYDANGNGFVEREEYGRFHFDRFGQNEGRQLPQAGAPVPTGQPAQGGDVAADPNAAGFDRARDRFQNSLFYDAFTEGFNRDRDAIDTGLAGQGLAFSSARMNAVENSRANNFLGALNFYTSTLLGQPSTAGAQGSANAASAFGANAGNINTNQANNLANSAYARAGNNNALVNNFANLGGSLLGSGIFGGGNPAGSLG